MVIKQKRKENERLLYNFITFPPKGLVIHSYNNNININNITIIIFPPSIEQYSQMYKLGSL